MQGDREEQAVVVELRAEEEVEQEGYGEQDEEGAGDGGGPAIRERLHEKSINKIYDIE